MLELPQGSRICIQLKARCSRDFKANSVKGAAETAEPEEVPSLAQAPLVLRLTYVRDLLKSLGALVAEDELKFLRYLLGMTADEAGLALRRAMPQPKD